jgi:cytoskeletal protein CcmA (bactofilin family)
MAGTPSSNENNKTGSAPEPEVLKPQSEEATSDSTAPKETPAQAAHKVLIPKKNRHGSYKPSHKATFIGLAVIILVLLINGVIIFFILRSNGGTSSSLNKDEVTLSTEALDGLGVSRNSVGDLGTQLTIGPDTTFNGSIKVAGATSIGGALTLNSKFTASDANLVKLQAGETAVNTLNVNGDTTTSNLNTRKDLTVAGLTRMQGAVTMASILTVNNNLNVAGNLAIGGALSVRNFQVNTLTINGHLISTGSAPGVSAGGGSLGSNGTLSISGNDTAGTIGVNIGAGGGSGCLASVSFRQQFIVTPRVVVTGSMPANIYLAGRTASGFTVCTASLLTPGGYFIDYIVVQ